jgi:hypothetical protein
MPTKPVNNIKSSVGAKTLFRGISNFLDNTISFNQGDILVYDDTNQKIKAISANNESPRVLGVAPVTVENGKLKSPYQGTAVDNAQGGEEIAGPVYGVEVELKLKNGDSIVPGQVVYADATIDAQTVTVTNTGDAIGVYNGEALTSNNSKILVRIGCRYPENVLKF